MEFGVPDKAREKPPSTETSNPFGIPSQHVIHELPGCRVVRTGTTVHKFGPAVKIQEGLAQEFASSIGLPVPKLHGVRHSDHGGVTQYALEMEYVEGQTLCDAWTHLTEAEQLSVAQQLRQIIVKMRSARLPPDVMIGSMESYPVRDVRDIDIHSGGPFKNESDFNQFQLNLYESTPNVLVEAIRTRLRNDHQIVFSHGDLNQRNIIVKGSTIVAILDWEVAGWYPEHWDFVKFFFQSTTNRGWHDHANEIFSVSYFDELLLQYTIRLYQRG